MCIRDRLRTVPALDVDWCDAQVLVHSTFHFFGDRADLTIGPPRGEHQRVKGIDELTQVEHHAVQTQDVYKRQPEERAR